MKKILMFFIIILLAFITWFFSFPRNIKRENYLTEKVLAKSSGISAKIDVELLKKLGSAYE